MNKRALLISLVVGVIGVLLLLLYLSRFEQEASGGERVRLADGGQGHRAGFGHRRGVAHYP